MKPPKTMRAVVVEKLVGKYGEGKEALEECLVIKQVPTPVPTFSQVLVRIQRSQINPSDTSFVQGRYGKTCTPGVSIPGFEACGIVVSHGGSPFAWRLMGKKVSVFATEGGCWAEYIACEWMNCFDVGSDVPWSNAAGAIANPMTVQMMCDLAREERVVVCTAGTSSLVEQFVRAAKSRNIQTIVIVRHAKDVADSQANGAFHTLDYSNEEEFAPKLKQLCAENKVRMAFDSVAGDIGSAVFAALVPGGEMHVYGFLSGKPLSTPGAELIFKRKTLRGLWLGQEKGLFKLMRLRNQVIAGLKTDLRTKVRCTFALEQVVDALLTYTATLSGGKVHLVIGDYESDLVMQKA